MTIHCSLVQNIYFLYLPMYFWVKKDTSKSTCHLINFSKKNFKFADLPCLQTPVKLLTWCNFFPGVDRLAGHCMCTRMPVPGFKNKTYKTVKQIIFSFSWVRGPWICIMSWCQRHPFIINEVTNSSSFCARIISQWSSRGVSFGCYSKIWVIYWLLYQCTSMRTVAKSHKRNALTVNSNCWLATLWVICIRWISCCGVARGTLGNTCKLRHTLISCLN